MRLVDLQVGDLFTFNFIEHFDTIKYVVVLIEKDEKTNYYKYYFPKDNSWTTSFFGAHDQYKIRQSLKVLK